MRFLLMREDVLYRERWIMKRLLIFCFLALFFLDASAQFALPMLDRSSKVIVPAASAWRDVNTVGFNAIANVKGDVVMKTSAKETDIGDVSVSGSVPSVVGAFKGESLSLELYYSTNTKKNVDLDFEYAANVNVKQTIDQTLGETRLGLSYLLNDTLSLGLGYRKNQNVSEMDKTVTVTGFGSTTSGSKSTETETANSLSVSWVLSEIFFLTGAMESVSYLNATDGTDDTTASWSSMGYGIGLMTGSPGDTRFRLEYSLSQIPKCKDNNDKVIMEKSTIAYASLGAQFGDYFVELRNKSESSEKDEAGSEMATVTTMYGGGWMPDNGWSFSAYAFGFQKTRKESSSEMIFSPSGYRIQVGFNY
jgi:hypothetical protein